MLRQTGYQLLNYLSSLLDQLYKRKGHLKAASHLTEMVDGIMSKVVPPRVSVLKGILVVKALMPCICHVVETFSIIPALC